MSGNCATGMRVNAIAPARVMTIAITTASRGRRMKTAEIIGVSPLARCRGAQGALCAAGSSGRHQLAGTDALDTFDDNMFAVIESALDGNDTWRRRTELHATLLHLVLAVDDIDIIALLIRQDRKSTRLNSSHSQIS